jgi:hypothetical protein
MPLVLAMAMQTRDMGGNWACAVNWLFRPSRWPFPMLPFFGMAVWFLASSTPMRHRDIENGHGPGCADVSKYFFECHL